jgi:hypothetical protein
MTVPDGPTPTSAVRARRGHAAAGFRDLGRFLEYAPRV